MKYNFFQNFTTVCLVSGALFLTGCGSSNTGDGSNQSIIEFSQQPIATSHALAGSTSNAFDLALKDRDGNAVSESGTINLALISSDNTASPAGQVTMTDGIVDDATITFTGAPGTYTIGAQLFNSSNQPQTTIFVSDPITLVSESQLIISVQNPPTLNEGSPSIFSASAQFLPRIDGVTGTTPVHGVNKDVELRATGPGSLNGTATIQSVNGVANFTNYSVSQDGDYNFDFVTTIDGSLTHTGPTGVITLTGILP